MKRKGREQIWWSAALDSKLDVPEGRPIIKPSIRTFDNIEDGILRGRNGHTHPASCIGIRARKSEGALSVDKLKLESFLHAYGKPVDQVWSDLLHTEVPHTRFVYTRDVPAVQPRFKREVIHKKRDASLARLPSVVPGEVQDHAAVRVAKRAKKADGRS